MAQTSKSIRSAYDSKTYKQYAIRVRRKSQLYERLEQIKSTPGESLNHIICNLLSTHYGVPMPEAQNDTE